MYLPKTYEGFIQTYPEIQKQYQELGQSCRECGPLDAKAQNLVKLGIAIGANSRGGVMSSVRKALAAGATPEEIRHCVLMALTLTGFPNMIVSMGWVSEVLDQSKDPAPKKKSQKKK
ncbi:MAG: carboxymuconolactone decarboxylase family protein [Deltaproteobacteria bacterium]|nr:carboxymuconolactone decarboxylase family protein [Deltaproteobacteria bacterium]